MLKLRNTERKAVGRETGSAIIADILILFVIIIDSWFRRNITIVIFIVTVIGTSITFIIFIIIEFAIEIRLGKQVDGVNYDWFGKLYEHIVNSIWHIKIYRV